jgi:hypothetical protein
MTVWLRVSAVVLAFGILPAPPAAAQPADAPARIVLLVDSSGSIAPWVNQFRAGLNAFLDTLPEGDDEIALISTGGQLRVRVPPTTDRARLRAAVAGFASDSGANAFLDSLLESDQRFLKPAPDLWSVIVILTTDAGQARRDQNVDAYNRFARDFVGRRASAHAVVLRGLNTGLITDFSENLVHNTQGVFETMTLATSLPEKMRQIAERIIADHHPRRPF